MLLWNSNLNVIIYKCDEYLCAKKQSKIYIFCSIKIFEKFFLKLSVG